MGFVRVDGGWRYDFGGLKTNTAADEMPPTKYPYARNVRHVKSLQTRPGYELLFDTNPPVSVRLSVLQDGVEMLAVSVVATDPHYIADGLQQMIAFRTGFFSDYRYDDWANGDGTSDLFTDNFNRANSPTIGANWIQSDIGGLSVAFHIASNRLLLPNKAVADGTPLQLATPVSATAIVDQHCQIRFPIGGTIDTVAPLQLALRGNGSVVGTWVGYVMLRITSDVTLPDGFERYNIQIGHYTESTNTLVVLADTGTLTGAVIGTPFTMKFKAIQV